MSAQRGVKIASRVMHSRNKNWQLVKIKDCCRTMQNTFNSLAAFHAWNYQIIDHANQCKLEKKLPQLNTSQNLVRDRKTIVNLMTLNKLQIWFPAVTLKESWSSPEIFNVLCGRLVRLWGPNRFRICLSVHYTVCNTHVRSEAHTNWFLAKGVGSEAQHDVTGSSGAA